MYNEDRKQRFYEFKLKTVASVTPLVPRFKRVAPFIKRIYVTLI
jgi:hypothetical protein